IIGAKYLQPNLKVLATSARLIVIGLQGGVKTELYLNHLLSKRAAVMATSLRARPPGEKASNVACVAQQIGPRIDGGQDSSNIDRTLPLDSVVDAHRALEDSSAIGKIVLTMAR